MNYKVFYRIRKLLKYSAKYFLDYREGKYKNFQLTISWTIWIRAKDFDNCDISKEEIMLGELEKKC